MKTLFYYPATNCYYLKFFFPKLYEDLPIPAYNDPFYGNPVNLQVIYMVKQQETEPMLYKGKCIHTITHQDIGKSYGKFASLGRVLPSDVGKQIWQVDGICYVENDTQVLKRLALAYIIGNNQAVELPA